MLTASVCCYFIETWNYMLHYATRFIKCFLIFILPHRSGTGVHNLVRHGGKNMVREVFWKVRGVRPYHGFEGYMLLSALTLPIVAFLKLFLNKKCTTIIYILLYPCVFFTYFINCFIMYKLCFRSRVVI